MRNLLIILLFLGTSHKYHSNLIIEQSNTIYNASSLNSFLNSLDSLESKKDQIVRIIHIGDSHIQANFLTGTTRKLFQQRFGNAGRGFVFPYKIAKSGGPLDVDFTYEGYWSTCNILRSYNNCNIGASGFTVSGSNNSRFNLKVENNELDYSFNKIELFNKHGALLPNFPSTLNMDGSNKTTIWLDQATDSLDLIVSSENGEMAELQGLILENGKPGIIYNSMGINGTAVLQYLRSSFESNIADMQPNLVILSFGTNDCYLPSSRFCLDCTKDRFKQLITRIKNANPNVAILITTPPDHFYRRSYSSVTIPKLRDALYELANEENVALWDLNGLMGGKNSIRSWADESLARRDLIHFTAAGYELQGQMLYEALMNAYQEKQ